LRSIDADQANGASHHVKNSTKADPETSLPPQFRQIRLELAGELGHPEGEHDVAYVIIAPLTPDGRIDPKLWKNYPEACRIVRQRPKEQAQLGLLVYYPGGAWGFHYVGEANLPDEAGYHFADEHFVAGEYVSINERGKMHTYRVTSVSHL
jgi:acetyl esterase/lipase